MTNLEHANELELIYIKGQSLNHTAKYIIEHLKRNELELAYRTFETDGDKLPSYINWARPFLRYFIDNLGCRSHRNTKCNNWLCSKLRESLND